MLLNNSFPSLCVWLLEEEATGSSQHLKMTTYALKPSKHCLWISLGTARSLLLERRSKAWREIKYMKIKQK